MNLNMDAASVHVGPKMQEHIKTGEAAESTGQIKFYSSRGQKHEEKDRNEGMKKFGE